LPTGLHGCQCLGDQCAVGTLTTTAPTRNRACFLPGAERISGKPANAQFPASHIHRRRSRSNTPQQQGMPTLSTNGGKVTPANRKHLSGDATEYRERRSCCFRIGLGPIRRPLSPSPIKSKFPTLPLLCWLVFVVQRRIASGLTTCRRPGKKRKSEGKNGFSAATGAGTGTGSHRQSPVPQNENVSSNS